MEIGYEASVLLIAGSGYKCCKMERMLTEKCAVVTGGTRGIGYAIVRKLLQEGAKVALCGSSEGTVSPAVGRLREEFPGADLIGIWPNLSSPADVAYGFDVVKECFGRIDILVNNAGISQSTSFYDYKEDEFDKILDINVKAVMICSQTAARIMKEEGGGAIINTSSVVSLYGQPSGCAYPATKFAVNGLTKSLARELGKDGIRVNAVAPGITRTDMVAKLPEEVIQPLVTRIPLGRIGEAEDIANAVCFLASDMASYITGTVLSVDGGVVV